MCIRDRKKKEGVSPFSYEDDTRLQLDFVMIQKFSKLGLSPPVDVNELEATEKTIISLRDALKIKGNQE